MPSLNQAVFYLVMPSYTAATSRARYQAMDRDAKACRSNGAAQFSVKDKGCMSLSPQSLRENRRNMANMQPLASPAIVVISNATMADATPGSQFEAVMAAEQALSQSRPSTPPLRHAGQSSLAPPIELGNRPPSTPKKQRKPYDGIGVGTPPRSLPRSKAKEAAILFICNPGPDTSCSPRRTSSGRSVSRSSSYSGLPVDSCERGPLSLIDYPHYEMGKLTIATEESGLLHFVPQVFEDSPSLWLSERRPMISFTKDVNGIGLDHSDGVLRDTLEMLPGNPHCIYLELYYPGLPNMSMKYDFMSRNPENRRSTLFATVKLMVANLVKDAPRPMTMPRGLESWDPVKLYERKWFRVLGLKHICDNRYLIALGVSSQHIPHV